MGSLHLQRLLEMEAIEVVGVADPEPRVRRRVARIYRVPAFERAEDVLELAPDFVVIAAPSSLHCRLTMLALDAGAHVLVEKPIALTVPDGEKMIQKARARARKLLVGHIERYNPLTERLYRLVKEGTVGRLLSVTSVRLGPPPARRDASVLLDTAIHDIDVASFLLEARAYAVECVAGRCGSSVYDHADLMLRYPGERASHIIVSWHSSERIRKIFLVGTEGFLFGDYIDQSVFLFTRHTETWQRIRPRETEEPIRRELEDFLHAIREDVPPRVDPDESLYSLRVALSAEASAAAGAPVHL